jgi:C1A family cysteine protease
MSNLEFFGGWKPDKPDARDKIANYKKKRGINVSTIDLRTTGLLPPIFDQGRSSSCTGNAIAAAVEYMRKKEQLPSFIPSRLFIYYNERLLENDVNKDSGAELRDGMIALQKWGVCPENLWPFIVPDEITVKPPQQCYDFAVKDVIKTYERVPTELSAVQNTLSHGIPFVFGISVFENFMDTGSDGMVAMPQGNLLGGHAILTVGLQDDKVIFQNSWGESWGDGGYGYIPQDYFFNDNLCGDFWAITVA